MRDIETSFNLPCHEHRKRNVIKHRTPKCMVLVLQRLMLSSKSTDSTMSVYGIWMKPYVLQKETLMSHRENDVLCVVEQIRMRKLLSMVVRIA